MVRLRAPFYGLAALLGVAMFLVLVGPVVAGIVVNKAPASYVAAEIDPGAMRAISNGVAEPLPASDADDLSDQPPGEAPE